MFLPLLLILFYVLEPCSIFLHFAIFTRLFLTLPSSHHHNISWPSFKCSPLPSLKFSCPYHFSSFWRNFHSFSFLYTFWSYSLPPLNIIFWYSIFFDPKYILSNFQVSRHSGGSLALPQSQWSVGSTLQILKNFLSPAIFDVFTLFCHHRRWKLYFWVDIPIVLDDALLLNVVSISYD